MLPSYMRIIRSKSKSEQEPCIGTPNAAEPIIRIKSIENKKSGTESFSRAGSRSCDLCTTQQVPRRHRSWLRSIPQFSPQEPGMITHPFPTPKFEDREIFTGPPSQTGRHCLAKELVSNHPQPPTSKKENMAHYIPKLINSSLLPPL